MCVLKVSETWSERVRTLFVAKDESEFPSLSGNAFSNAFFLKRNYSDLRQLEKGRKRCGHSIFTRFKETEVFLSSFLEDVSFKAASLFCLFFFRPFTSLLRIGVLPKATGRISRRP